MKRSLTVVAIAAMLAAGTQCVFAYDQAAAGKSTKKLAGEPGAIEVNAVSATASVSAIDGAKRNVTLDMNGKFKTITCGPEVRNFDQIQLGDKVKTTFVEALAVSIQHAGTPAGSDFTNVTLAPKGAKPGMLVTKLFFLNGNVDNIDTKKRTVTVTTPNGKTKKMKVANTVTVYNDLKKGDDVDVRFTEAMAIVVETPKHKK
jgi:hypothetical protein